MILLVPFHRMQIIYFLDKAGPSCNLEMDFSLASNLAFGNELYRMFFVTEYLGVPHCYEAFLFKSARWYFVRMALWLLQLNLLDTVPRFSHWFFCLVLHIAMPNKQDQNHKQIWTPAEFEFKIHFYFE